MPNTQLKTGTHYINGRWVHGQGATFVSQNPVNHQTIWQGRQAEESDVHAAFDAAHKASQAWSSLALEQRMEHLTRFAACVEAQQTVLTDLISLETGKPRWEAATETTAVIQKIALSIQAYHARTATNITPSPELETCLRYKPHGVVGVLGAFNFPAHLSNGHIVPALLAGNTVVYKPSEHTPAVAELIMRFWHESGLPVGVLNCIQGHAQTAQHLLQENLQGVFFTGSYQTGLKIHQHFSSRPEVLVALEMGGNNPLIIDDKLKNIPAAVYNTLLSSFLTTGQRCTSARRLMIPNTSTGEDFLEQLLKASKNLSFGPPGTQPESFMGPVIHPKHAKQHLQSQKKLITLGAKPLLAMQTPDDSSAFLSPGILDMHAVSNPPDEEIFGPLIQLYRYDTFEQALDLANQTQYGLAAGLLGNNRAHYEQFYHTVRAGLINWNRPTTGASSSLPFGGVGHSGNHRPSAYFAADYSAYPIASLEAADLNLPDVLIPGIHLGET
jgi:succinylglutamic semialdehyde dehydrogenase